MADGFAGIHAGDNEEARITYKILLGSGIDGGEGR